MRRTWIATSILGVCLFAFPGTAWGRCGATVIHDYSKPLRGLPSLRERPRSELIPFAPGRVWLGSGGSNGLQLGSGEIGYGLSYGEGVPRLDWTVTSKLTRLHRASRTEQLVAFHKHRIGRPERRGDDLSFTVGDEDALYRIDLVIRDRKGKVLGR